MISLLQIKIEDNQIIFFKREKSFQLQSVRYRLRRFKSSPQEGLMMEGEHRKPQSLTVGPALDRGSVFPLHLSALSL